MSACGHVEGLPDAAARTPEGCEECLESGGRWVHLRRCLSCGHVGCCDSSPNRHATAHFGTSTHPVVASFEPGERWRWCYLDEAVV
ncbi:UBP-type zinc finger domain-containing protein [Kineococcus sp. NUM-3379]